MRRPQGRPAPHPSALTRVSRPVASLLVAGLLLAGCGDDSGVEAAADGDPAAYCALVEEFDSQDSAPSDEQLDELVAVAPAEIRADTERFTDAVRTGDMEAEGVAEAEARLLAWEEANCG
jgi:iron uptake system EfeUOB component EfeO/EfeM